MSLLTADFVIIGAGIVGLAIARELKKREPKSRIIIFEKENQIGLHASGRNSGVLHSGIYYPENSLKAKVCAEGAREMANYCDEHKLPINRIGKVIIPTLENQDSQLALLYQRATKNKARVEIIDANQLKEIEPMAYTATGKALFCPDTAVIDSKSVLQHISQSLQKNDVVIELNSKVTSIDSTASTLIVNNQKYSYGHLFNSAGLYADIVVKKFGIDKYTIVPFKGIYYRLDPNANIKINRLIYPVPDLNMPFLGIHFTKSVNGDVLAGPTAIPALGRENYNGLQNINLTEALSIFTKLSRLYLTNTQHFRNFVHAEAARFIKTKFAKAAKSLIPQIKSEHLLASNKVGIRAQLFDLEKQELIMDFLVEQVKNSTHVLNAVSPAFTSSFSFSRLVVDKAMN